MHVLPLRKKSTLLFKVAHQRELKEALNKGYASESLHCAVLETSPYSVYRLTFCAPGALRFIPPAHLFNTSLK
jgi:hypothetical protein